MTAATLLQKNRGEAVIVASSRHDMIAQPTRKFFPVGDRRLMKAKERAYLSSVASCRAVEFVVGAKPSVNAELFSERRNGFAFKCLPLLRSHFIAHLLLLWGIFEASLSLPFDAAIR